MQGRSQLTPPHPPGFTGNFLAEPFLYAGVPTGTQFNSAPQCLPATQLQKKKLLLLLLAHVHYERTEFQKWGLDVISRHISVIILTSLAQLTDKRLHTDQGHSSALGPEWTSRYMIYIHHSQMTNRCIVLHNWKLMYFFFFF